MFQHNNNSSDKYKNLPIEQWPEFQILWDLSPINYRYAFDGMSKSDFDINYPDGLLLAYADLEELDSKFSTYSYRRIDETWTVGIPSKLAKAMEHWIQCNQMTPPVITNNMDYLNISAGHHRFAICRAKKLKRLPILIYPHEKDGIDSKINSIEWQ